MTTHNDKRDAFFFFVIVVVFVCFCFFIVSESKVCDLFIYKKNKKLVLHNYCKCPDEKLFEKLLCVVHYE